MNRPETRRKPPLRPILVAVGLALSAGPVAPRAVAAAPATAKGNQLDLKQFGAVGDGRRDDRPALSRALAALKAAGGGTLYVPDGTYKVVATAHDAYLSVPPNVTIRGRKGFSRVVLSSDDPKGIASC